jgi:chromatin remodeling complex protein RSC6
MKYNCLRYSLLIDRVANSPSTQAVKKIWDFISLGYTFSTANFQVIKCDASLRLK